MILASGVVERVIPGESELHCLHTLEAAAERLAISLRTLRRYIDLRRSCSASVRRVRLSEQEIRRVIRDGVPEV